MHQDEERCLKCVLGVMRVNQDTAADRQNHRPVTFYQNVECRLGALVVAQDESL
jgi:hypothetical protein